ncbi:GNAT family N-acetyltransferase [Bordetella ansorpii]|uniref:GNAT family N-acetyltransferase n=1 Tax=Bordetella ansorpii TaxID=288768 RepID=UPI0038B35F2F
MEAGYALRPLGEDDAQAYQASRLEALRDRPEAFASSWEDERAQALPWFAARLRDGFVAGAFDAQGALVGTAGLLVPASPKLRHKGMLWGMYVSPRARGTGVAPALVRAVLDEAQGLVEAVRLTVTVGNEAARRLYLGLGFEEYAREPRALKVGGRYYDEILMARAVE